MKFHGFTPRQIERQLDQLFTFFTEFNDDIINKLGISKPLWQRMMSEYEDSFLQLFADKSDSLPEFVQKYHSSKMSPVLARAEPLIHFMGDCNPHFELLHIAIRRWGGFDCDLEQTDFDIQNDLWANCDMLLSRPVNVENLERRFSIYVLDNADQIEDKLPLTHDVLIEAEELEEQRSEAFPHQDEDDVRLPHPATLVMLHRISHAAKLQQSDKLRFVTVVGGNKEPSKPAVYATEEGIKLLEKRLPRKLFPLLPNKKSYFSRIDDQMGKPFTLN